PDWGTTGNGERPVSGLVGRRAGAEGPAGGRGNRGLELFANGSGSWDLVELLVFYTVLSAPSKAGRQAVLHCGRVMFHTWFDSSLSLESCWWDGSNSLQIFNRRGISRRRLMRSRRVSIAGCRTRFCWA